MNDNNAALADPAVIDENGVTECVFELTSPIEIESGKTKTMIVRAAGADDNVTAKIGDEMTVSVVRSETFYDEINEYTGGPSGYSTLTIDGKVENGRVTDEDIKLPSRAVVK